MPVIDPLQVEEFRGELLGYCYRFFGCYPEAEDAVQETMLRAWNRGDGFAGQSSVRTWLYRIATNICLDMKRAPQRRALPMDMCGPGVVPDDLAGLTTREAECWVGPVADDRLRVGADPAEIAVHRESLRLAFVTALQLLPPRQRVVLILRDVLAWSAAECAELLAMSVASVNSALARARRTLADHDPADRRAIDDASERALFEAYVAAFEAYDVDRLVKLLAEDAVFSMPPYALWLRGATDVEAWWRGPGQVCRGSRVLPTRANGGPAAAVYHPVGHQRWEPFALHVVDVRDGRIAGLTHFMGPAVFAELGLPSELVATG
ncbi:sigma-70 family RNA polymerase sigma factor [Saccharopolyspora taberi]|uniref:sigma-70 family RNA polymerase sigma factor n=1 Tax=Saccharopolyspora taberi TaxID=60895 RepID=UPI0031E2C86B